MCSRRRVPITAQKPVDRAIICAVIVFELWVYCMDESYQPRRKRASRARDRYESRRRHEAMVSRRSPVEINPRINQRLRITSARVDRLFLNIRDLWWYASHTPRLRHIVFGAVGIYVLLFIGIHLLQGRIFPNIWSMGIYLGDLTVEEARLALLSAWENEIKIQMTDGDRQWLASPSEIGLSFDPQPIIDSARGLGMAGIPVGWHIEPPITLNEIAAQNYLLDLTTQVEIPPRNAGYKIENGAVVGIPGSEGRMMDVGLTLETIKLLPTETLLDRRLDLTMTVLEPEMADPDTYIDAARAMVAQPFQLIGYDPYRDEAISWATTPEVFVTWLQATNDGLTLRDDTFAPFLEAQNASLVYGADDTRYLEPNETLEKMRAAIGQQAENVILRVRYRPTKYEVVSGDRAYGIARKTGIPYFLIEEANLERDLNTLSVGDVLNIPSRDVTLPVDPTPTKRIIINLETQSLAAYENGQEVFRWLISSGMDSAPTSPGIFQIQSHEQVALGSSYTLCGAEGCSQWEMYYFMGIYEVIPGLMNGFHGAVLLPDGTYLGGGNVGRQFTYGCIMSLNENAELLYNWAEIGTVVEIISSEYPPQSEIAKRAFAGETTAQADAA